ncbi:glucosyltransferase [Agyrium rufum]|nr:glucosyltransferase [Agyrium rufum]
MSRSIIRPAVLRGLGAVWFYNIATRVADPYLDEYFHVRQAIAYWNHDLTWDPKITTPPGLYIISYLWLYLCKVFHLPGSLTVQLRGFNLLLSIWPLYFTLQRLSTQLSAGNASDSSAQTDSCSKRTAASSWKIEHIALNACLFPPLFFFYALYYTDVLSACLVLLAFDAFRSRQRIKMVTYSILSLTLRQTNIFWVSIFLGGLEVIRTVKSKTTNTEKSHVETTVIEMIKASYMKGYVYDPPIGEAGIEDYPVCVVTSGLASLRSIFQVMQALLSYIAVLLMFACFVVWNGGVVLGDKSNHVATVHLPQMLYIWPYITFFSWPLLYPYFLTFLRILPSSIQSMLPRSAFRYTPAIAPPRILVMILSTAVACLIVRFNTLIHPFTLADNRHYTFYVFRILLRHPAIKYLITPVYVLCGWVAIQAMGGWPQGESGHQSFREPPDGNKSEKISEDEAPAPIAADKRDGQSVSFVLVFLLATSLSLISAPLVEPRYFVVPWLIWRLHVPSMAPPRPDAKGDLAKPSTEEDDSIPNLWLGVNLYIETAWYIVVNVVTGYIFLNWGFDWPSEPGKVQRFMW